MNPSPQSKLRGGALGFGPLFFGSDHILHFKNTNIELRVNVRPELAFYWEIPQ